VTTVKDFLIADHEGDDRFIDRSIARWTSAAEGAVSGRKGMHAGSTQRQKEGHITRR